MTIDIEIIFDLTNISRNIAQPIHCISSVLGLNPTSYYRYIWCKVREVLWQVGYVMSASLLTNVLLKVRHFQRRNCTAVTVPSNPSRPSSSRTFERTSRGGNLPKPSPPFCPTTCHLFCSVGVYILAQRLF